MLPALRQGRKDGSRSIREIVVQDGSTRLEVAHRPKGTELAMSDKETIMSQR